MRIWRRAWLHYSVGMLGGGKMGDGGRVGVGSRGGCNGVLVHTPRLSIKADMA